MTTTAASLDPTASAGPSPTVRFLLRNFVIYNPLFTFSAMLVLGGAFLINPAQSDGGRAVPLLLKLLGVIGLYQVALLAAAGFLYRRGYERFEREVRGLVLLLTPFLLDVTFTTSSLTVTLIAKGGVGAAALLIGAILTITAVEMRIAAGLRNQRFAPLTWAALLLGPALALCVPAIGAALALNGHADVVGLVVGALLAAFVVIVGFASGTEGGPDVLRRVAPLMLSAALAHALMSAWTYQAPLLHVVGPVLIAIGGVAPRIWKSLEGYGELCALTLPVAGAFLCGMPQAIDGGPPVGAWTLGLITLAAVHGAFFWRTQAFPFLAGVLAATLLAAGGSTFQTSVGAIGTNPFEPLALTALFAHGLWKRTSPGLLAVPLVLGAILTARLGLLGNGLDIVLGLDLVGLGILASTHRVHGLDVRGAVWRCLGALLLFLPACVVAIAPAAGALHATASILAGSGLGFLFLLACWTRLRIYAIPAAILPVAGLIQVAPSSAQGWGVLGLVGAFALVCLGVVVSLKREQVLAWLSELEAAEAEAGQPVERVVA